MCRITTISCESHTACYRVLWLPGSIDHCLAEEIDGGATYWTLLDHLNTVQDIVTYSLASHETTLAQHNQFNSFGVLISTPTVETIALWTGRLQDYLTKKQSNRERWYDALLARWMSEDPIGFQAGDVNLYRYVGNEPVAHIDAFGLDVYKVVIDNGVATSTFYRCFRNSAAARSYMFTAARAHPGATISVSTAGLTADQKKAINLCNGDRTCEEEMAVLLTLVEKTGEVRFGWNTCHRWVDKFRKNKLDGRHMFTKLETSQLIVPLASPGYCTKDHGAFRVRVNPSGVVGRHKTFYLDNGAFGDQDDHIFWPEDWTDDFEIPEH